MNMKVSKEWWKNFFDHIYLITDARSVNNEKLTRREVDLLEKALKPAKDDAILDFCGGQGRHSLELARRGYSNLTVLDYSRYLVRLGKQLAKEAHYNIRFKCADARDSGLKSNAYSIIFIMANSFGYFPNERDNLRILHEAHRLLKPRGKILLDLSDPDFIRKSITPLSWHEADNDIVVCRHRIISKDIVKAREMVISKTKGLIRDRFYCERIYDREKMTSLLRRVGFCKPKIQKNVLLHRMKGDYGFLTSRMIITATKP